VSAPVITPADIVTRRTPCGEFRVSINVYAIQRRDGIGFREATNRAEAIAYYASDRPEAEDHSKQLLSWANAHRAAI
jgi:hypothetical protein